MNLLKNLSEYLIGLSDQVTDVHLRVRCFVVIAHWSLLHCGGQWAVFVCHTIEKPARENNSIT